MSEYSEHEILTLHAQQTEQQIIELNRTIVALRSKVAFLEKDIEERERIPVPRSVLKQILEMEHKIRKLEEENSLFRKHVPKRILINRENTEKPTRKGGLR
jgi:hypothetical protein